MNETSALVSKDGRELPSCLCSLPSEDIGKDGICTPESGPAPKPDHAGTGSPGFQLPEL